MASKGPRLKLDHETRTKRQKALEVPREPRRPKTHWDHVLEEMVWLSKDFESERKWKLNLAKKVALKASKGMLDQATKGERKLKEEEQRLRKVALNISKDIKKFWLKIEKLVLYNHQMELDVKKKKVLDKQLEFLLGQTERYSTMLAENLVDTSKSVQHDRLSIQCKEEEKKLEDESRECVGELVLENVEVDDDYDVLSEDESEDDEHTMEEDEALITEEERREELEALRNEVDLPLEELLQRYSRESASVDVSVEESEAVDETTLMQENHDGGEVSPGKSKDEAKTTLGNVNNGDNSNLHIGCKNETDEFLVIDLRCRESNDEQSLSESHMLEASKINLTELDRSKFDKDQVYDFSDEHEDDDFILAGVEEKDDETTLLEEEELAKGDQNNPMDEIALLQKESELPLEELLSRYKKDSSIGEDTHDESEYDSTLSENFGDSPSYKNIEHLHLDACSEAPDQSGEFRPFTHSSAEEGEGSLTRLEDKESENIIADAAAAARSAQPTGNTFSTTQVRTKFPFLLKHPLREYQHIGLDWLVTMYEKRLNGILADEMGLGKTIMTISMLAHLACEKGIWGPHLIVVPTSVMLNWETEFLKWCPAFKILTYFGSAKERKFKRQGWMKLNSFHVCITTYRLVIQDSKVFKRKKWKYLILDEAHLIKNWKSQRWQTLLNFNSKRRILLTGTPLQNDLMELWSLMHFLMPHVFQSHQEFKDWFSNPITGMVEGQEKVNKEVVDRLHNVLRPFILRRLKRDVEKQLPMKHEHVIYCRLSRRQRNLYEDFIASSETQATLASANFFGMISVIMQLRKVCNHPDLFEGRPIISSFDMSGIDVQLSSSVCTILSPDPFSTVDLNGMGLLFTHFDFEMTSWESDAVKAIHTPSSLIRARGDLCTFKQNGCDYEKELHGINIFAEIRKALMEERVREAKERSEAVAWWNSLRCNRKPIYSSSLRELVSICHPVHNIHHQKANYLSYLHSSRLANIILTPVERLEKMINLVESFMFAIPAARAPPPACWFSGSGSNVFLHPSFKQKCSHIFSPLLTPVRPAIVRRQVYFPDRRLVQFDCGKLQELARLLRKLKSEGHRALIFTQMTKMLDILEFFINLYGYTYMRLDGSTQPEERQTLMQRFNTNPKIFLFILSTRSGGVGINLVGADTVIFYDSDWNPAMDQQAQDRCHRIGQTREVHIYRLISESTIEENILKKANQKRALDNLVIQSGDYNTDFFKKLDPMELFSGHRSLSIRNTRKEEILSDTKEVTVSNADVEAALKLAEDEADYMALKKVEEEEAVDNQEFTEEPIGRIEDDEFMNDDEMKVDEPGDQGNVVIMSNLENGVTLISNDPYEDNVPHSPTNEDVDMLADVKQMAAAAAAGQATSSFEKLLRPIDQYAIRFLELWDPIIDKRAIESQGSFEETEWELDRIEKYKEEMEAEIDEDEEPLVYEKWDADFATEAYRQQVEALAQHMLMEELESEAKDTEGLDENCDSTRDVIAGEPKLKSKKKAKKAKFKSLKKGTLSSELKHVKQESSSEPTVDDDDFYDEDGIRSEVASPPYLQKKRKKVEFNLEGDEEKTLKKKAKKFSKNPSKMFSLDLDSNVLPDEVMESKSREYAVDLEQKHVGRSKTGGKISITAMPVKRVLMIKPEKIKRGNIWSRDCVPSPDFWLTQEDAVICAIVHEYGPCWSLVSETLYGMTAGGFYRGRYRHPVHCCERYRELIQRYILSVADHANNDKITNGSSGKALLKVTEENLRSLLDIAAELPNHEFLLQKHFTALLVCVWKRTSQDKYQHKLSSTCNGLFSGNSRNGLSSGNSVSTSAYRNPQYLTGENTRLKFTNSEQSLKSLATALHDASGLTRQDDKPSCSGQRENASITAGHLEISLELQGEKEDSTLSLPTVINLSVLEPDQSPYEVMIITDDHHLKASQNVAENRFRIAARACTEGSIEWASTVFPTYDLRSRLASKSQALGKHKPTTTDLVKPGKSKLRKVSTDKIETFNLNSEPLFQHVHPTGTKDLDQMFTTSSPIITDIEISDSDFSFGMAEQASLGIDNFETASHAYVPGVTSGLDDCLTFSEFVDIG